MKKALLCIAVLLVLAAGLLWLQTRRNYDSADTVEENGVLFCLRRDRREAFAGGYQWDGSGDAIEYSIPDTVQGVKVTAIGGWTGGLKKVPAAGPSTRWRSRCRYTSTSAAMSAASSRTAACRQSPATSTTPRAPAATSSRRYGR